eukprot:gene16502-19617_t
MTRDAHLSENIVQDIFTSLWERRSELKVLSVESYLFRAAKNQVLKEYRKRRFDTTIIEEKFEDYFIEQLPSVDPELLDTLYALLENLPEKRKQILMMNKIREMSIEEIADELKLSRQTVKNQISSALKQLRFHAGENSGLLIPPNISTMTKKNTHYLGHLTDKSKEKTISPAEQKLLDDFMQHEYDASAWDNTQMGARDAISARIYNNIQKLQPVKRPFWAVYKYAIAASVLLVFGLGIWLRSAEQNIKELVLTTASVTDSVKLKDGTVVYLAANSVFKYPEHFQGKIRSVALLKGNAFFKVAKDHTHPFVITSPQIKTRVLGTSFHISLDQGKSSVTVLTGKVRVSSGQQVAFLTPNENAVFSSSAGLKKQKLNDLSLYSWYKKDITLNEVTLDKVFTLLSFKYGASFDTADENILRTRITLYLKDGLPLQNILDQINYITHLKLKQHGNKIETDQ